MCYRRVPFTALILVLLFVNSCVAYEQISKVTENDETVKIVSDNIVFTVVKEGFRFSFSDGAGQAIVEPHAESGLKLGPGESIRAVRQTVYKGLSGERHHFLVSTRMAGHTVEANVYLKFNPAHAHFEIEPVVDEKLSYMIQIGGASPGFGLGDRASYGRYTTDITGYKSPEYPSPPFNGMHRMRSNFAIYPKHKFALVLIEPGEKIVRSNKQEIVQGAFRVKSISDLHFFFGEPKQIYKNFLEVRNASGYEVILPKYEFFGVGWESWGALAWNTNQKTVTEDITRYLAEGYPLSWMVVGSGFWPRHDPKYFSTTSFGYWDANLYPEPEELIKMAHENDMKFFIGLRITFIINGPFADEGVRKGYFLKEDGKAKIYRIDFPDAPSYLLDTKNPDAVQWYLDLSKKWTDAGIDGFKEDLWGHGNYDIPDDIVDPVNKAMMKMGIYIMGRNAYVSSPCDTHRINDFNQNENQDRGPINSLIFGYSGYPLVYPDCVGGTLAGAKPQTLQQEKFRKYIMRNTQWASVHPSMGMGIGPWNFGDPQVEKVCLDAAKLHDRLHPYFYSQAVRFYKEGFPWTFAPLPVVYPDDPKVYGRENNKVRGYQWMIGDALLATPLYGDDYDTAETRDVYLPAGTWIDYDTGKKYQGPKVLNNFALPLGKTPLFVGGTGIVIEKKDSKLVGRIYPVTSKAETIFWHKDVKTKSVINVDVADWQHAEVRNSKTATIIEGQWTDYALEFSFEPGENYVIQ